MLLLIRVKNETGEREKKRNASTWILSSSSSSSARTAAPVFDSPFLPPPFLVELLVFGAMILDWSFFSAVFFFFQSLLS